MRKIEKNCDLSSEYKTWEEQLEITQTPHPPYRSSSFKYYKDVIMQLFRCQNGLCAYTEQELCDDALFVNGHWQDGRFQGDIPKQDRFGQLEHFDESLKSKNKATVGIKDWLWENLFMVDSDINNRKGGKPVDDILKPDRDGYDPFSLLEYDPIRHVFMPHIELENSISKRVQNMIEILGINLVHSKRRKFLKDKFRLSKYEPIPLNEIFPN